jgi:hypothetical protein
MEIKIKKRTNWLCVLILSAFSLYLIFFEILLVSFIITDAESLDFIALICLPLIMLKLADIIFWNLRAYEQINVDKDKLIYQKKGKILPYKKTIFANEIDNIVQENYPLNIYTLRHRILGTKGGKIKVEYLDGKYQFLGIDITKNDAEKYIKQMKEILKLG